MQKIGKLKTYSSNEIKNSYVSIGFECLDRDLFNPDKCYDLLQKSGVKFARCQTGWAKCEKEKGVYDFGWLDSIVDNLLERGIKPWFNVGFGNPVYMSDVPNETGVGCVPLFYGDETLEAWKKYVHALTEHFESRIEYFEIWNEPNLAHFWYPQEPNGAEYARLVDLTADVIHSIYKDAKIIFNTSQVDCFVFLKDFLANVKKSSVDIYAFHMYTSIPEFRYAKCVAQLRKMLDESGFENVELWQGEGGYPSWAYEGHWLIHDGKTSERAQAVWQLRRYFLDIFYSIKRSSFFQMADMWEKPYAKAVEVINKPAAQGILNGITYTPKESYRTITNLAAIFSGDIKPASHYICVDIDSQSELELLSCSSMSYDKNGTPVYAYYLPTEVRKNTPISYKAEISVFDRIEDPVLIDPYTAEIFEIEGFVTHQGITKYQNLPIRDYPLMIAE
ncbi:MAG: beta-galactosidase, partial [Firmicutes bacterium]|nr:beta-galactosidase [Bacillota bacterium]